MTEDPVHLPDFIQAFVKSVLELDFFSGISIAEDLASDVNILTPFLDLAAARVVHNTHNGRVRHFHSRRKKWVARSLCHVFFNSTT